MGVGQSAPATPVAAAPVAAAPGANLATLQQLLGSLGAPRSSTTTVAAETGAAGKGPPPITSNAGSSIDAKRAPKAVVPQPLTTSFADGPIVCEAIMGVSCKLPGPSDAVAMYSWALGVGHDALAEIPFHRDLVASIDNVDVSIKQRCRSAGYVSTSGGFDCRRFGVAPAESAAMDRAAPGKIGTWRPQKSRPHLLRVLI